jgi:hypothetical protein
MVEYRGGVVSTWVGGSIPKKQKGSIFSCCHVVRQATSADVGVTSELRGVGPQMRRTLSRVK